MRYYSFLIAAAILLISGCGKKDPIVGQWEPEGAGTTLDIESGGEFKLDEPNESHRMCLQAGFEEAVTQCEVGYWELSEEGDSYLFGFPSLAVGVDEIPRVDGTVTTEVTHCRCQGRQIFPARLEADTLTINMERVGGPLMILHRR